MEVKVLGPGCANCDKLEKVVKDALSEADIVANVEKVTDIQEISKAGVMMTPALMINDEVKVSGKVPSKDEVVKLLKAK